jgi:adenylate kinase
VEFLVFLGPPGAGKGTISRLLERRTGFVPVSTGEVIRREMADAGSEFGRQARPYMDRGVYVPDELALSLFFSILNSFSGSARLALDGFPRTIPQAEVFLEWVKGGGHRFYGCVHLDLSVEQAVERMKLRRICSVCRTPYHLVNRPTRVAEVCDACGGRLMMREDDDPERVASRLERFDVQTQPLIAWFREKELCVEVDGGEDPVKSVEMLLRRFMLT